jgi:hypothetical protein
LKNTENSIIHTSKKLQYYKNSIDALDTLQRSQNNNQNIKSALDNYNNNIDSVQEISNNSLSINIKPENDLSQPDSDIKSTSIMNQNNNQENSKNNSNYDEKFDTSRLIPLLIGTGLGSGGVIGLGIGLSTIAYSKIYFSIVTDNLIATSLYWKKIRKTYEEALALEKSTNPVYVCRDAGGCAEIMTPSNYYDTATYIDNCYETMPLVMQCETEFTSVGTAITIVSAVVIVLAITALIIYLGMRFGWWNKLFK